MCGIAGYLSLRPFDEAVLARMVGALRHRGPDEAGFHHDGPFHAGMQRLSINDVARGHQPFFNGDRSVAMLYNGEIYNHLDLRRELEAKGHRFLTRTDGEVIPHLYDEYGEALFERLDGMFAVALWDSRRRRLILGRDIPGEKPLHYALLPGGGIAFASEIKALTQVPGVDLDLDRQALWDVPTFLWTPEPDTAYRNVKALPRRHFLVMEAGGAPRLQPYANRFNTEPLTDLSDAGIIAETRRVVEQAVESRLMADVAVGSFLSGGLDSSIVATLACRKLGPIDTFSIGFEAVADPYHGTADETEYARMCAEGIGSRHHAIHVTAADFRAALPDFARYGDQPFGVSSGLGILAIAQAAHARGLKVLLSGDGADEVFGGYSWYFHLNAVTRGQVSGPVPDGIVSFQNFGLELEARKAALARMTPPEQAWAWHYYAHEDEKAALFAPGFRDGLASSLRHFDGFREGAWAPEDYVAHDRGFYFPFEMMRKADRMTMAHSVEGRVPFAAPSVLSHADKLTHRHQVRGGSLKWALREAFRDVLPEAIVDRPKHGFNVPIDHWLKGAWSDLLAETFADGSALRRHNIVDKDAGTAARHMLDDPNRLNGHTLFCFVMMNIWLEQRDDATARPFRS